MAGKMIPLAINPPPGVVLTETDHVNEGRYSASRNIRFVKGRPQKTGGNTAAVVTPTSGNPRALHAWRDNSQNNYMAAGTYRKLYVYDSVWVQNDITPYRAGGVFGANPFATTNGSSTITVTHALHGLNAGDDVTISGGGTIAGLNFTTSFDTVVTLVPTVNTYTFTHPGGNANATTTGGTGANYAYEIPVGVEVGVYGLGWGVGGYGLSTYGSARGSSTIFIEPRIWSLDHFGKLLIASYNGGSIYFFDPTVAQPWPRAVILTSDVGLPTDCRFVFVTNERFIFALRDNMQVSWCSQGDYLTWTPAITNTANIRTLTEGTKLVAGRVLSDFISLVWSDAALFRFQYTGSTYIYNSSMVAKDCGLLAPNAAITVNGIAYWMGQDTFWTYNGSVTPMPNVEEIRKYVFDQVDIGSGYQCSAIYNPVHHEVWFFYTITGQVSPTLGLIYSIENQCWAPLDYGRVSGTHFTQGDTRPYMGAADGLIYLHEYGLDNNGVALPWSLTLSPYALNQGGNRMDLYYVVPDFKGQVGTITMTINSYDRLNDSAVEDTETSTIAAADSGTIDSGVSGRYVGMTLGASSLGCYMRLGKPVVWAKDAGERP